ncbi:MAG: hypothetical protein HEEMFOPI_01256 [Holosporales bacterium]
MVIFALFSVLLCATNVNTLYAKNLEHVKKESTLKRLEEFLHLLPTMKATFIQTNPDGKTIEGTLYIDRKNKKVRIEYPLIQQNYIVTDGFLFIHDIKQKDIQEMDAAYTPVGLLLQDNIKFNKTVQVIHLKETEKEAYLTLSDTKEADHGTMTFHFSIESFVKFLGWKIIDMQGLETTVKITKFEGAISLNPSLFLNPKLE